MNRPASVGSFPDYHISHKLDHTDNNENNDHRHPAHIRVPHLIAVADGEVSEASGSDGSGHGRDSHQTDKSNHSHAGDAGNTLL